MADDDDSVDPNFEEEEKKKAIQQRIQEQREIQQAKETEALLAWSRILLGERKLTANVLSHFHDGVLLINLLEIAFRDPMGRYNLTPKLVPQKHDNVSKALKYMVAHGVEAPSVDSTHIVEAQKKQIVVVLWNIMRNLLLRGLRKGKLGQEESPLRKTLLEYCSSNLGVTVADFSKTWCDGGFLISQLVNHLVPGSINLSALERSKAVENWTNALKIAEEHLFIPPIFDAKDAAECKVGDETMMNYVSMLLAAFQAKQQFAKKEEAVEAKQAQQVSSEDLEKKHREEQALLQKAIEEEKQKFLAMQAQLAASQEKDDRIKLLEAELAQMKEMEKACHAEKHYLFQYIEMLKLEGARQIGELQANLYSLHREHEDLLARIREEKTKENIEQRTMELTIRRHRRAYSHDSKEKRERKDYVASMKDHTASLLRRRPNAMFNSKRFKVQFFRLTGEKLHYYDMEGDKKPKGSYDLKEYNHAQQSSTAEDRFTFRLVPEGSAAKGNLLVEFRQLEGEDEDADRFIRRWFYELNRRVAVIRYLAEVKAGAQPGVEELFDFCMDDDAKELALENDRFMGFPLALNTLKRAIMYRPNLHTIYLCNVDLDDAIMTIISEIIHQTTAIQRLELPKNKITYEGVEQLAAALRLNRSVTELDFSHNPLKDKGVQKLFSVLAEHPTLKKVNLTGCGLTDASVDVICKALVESEKKNGRVHAFPSIDLGHNLISDSGALSITRLCTINPTIGVINLQHNNITDVGAQALAGIVDEKSKAQVTQINLAENQLSSKGVIALSEALKRSYYALTIDLSHNRLIGRQGINAIANPELSLDWILLKVRSQTSAVAASNSPVRGSSSPSSPSSPVSPSGGGKFFKDPVTASRVPDVQSDNDDDEPTSPGGAKKSRLGKKKK